VPRRVAPVLGALLILTAACDGSGSGSGESSSSRPAPRSEQVRTGVAALYVGDNPTPDDVADGECFADALLDRLDDTELEAAGIVQGGEVVPVLPALDVGTARVWVEAQGRCRDFVEVSTRALAAQSKGRVDPDAYAGCLRDALTAQQVDAALVDTLTGSFDTPEVGALSRAQAACARSSSPPE
jgi:hypothetical protein